MVQLHHLRIRQDELILLTEPIIPKFSHILSFEKPFLKEHENGIDFSKIIINVEPFYKPGFIYRTLFQRLKLNQETILVICRNDS